MLDSPVARQARGGRVTLGDASSHGEATLECGPEAGWLFACPERGRWVAAYHGLEPAPLRLSVPGGSVEVEAMETGVVVWDGGEVSVEAVELEYFTSSSPCRPHLLG